MHLLSPSEDGSLQLTEFVGRATTPAYAILSHTWGSDADEVTFKEIRKGRGLEKAGYAKIQFCMNQALKDGLKYCWVDTCCIDKTNNVELQEAINSMFKWYRHAQKCYVYLPDVPIDQLQRLASSRWFTRGWTLQELIAPEFVQFYSRDWQLLGDKQSLIYDVHSITQLPLEALQGQDLGKFSVAERMTWIERRQTKREEDLAYSLLGIFDVLMPLLYGEGQDRAFARLRAAIKETEGPAPFRSLETRVETFDVPFHLANAPAPLELIGRKSELRLIADALPYGNGRHALTLHGLGGVGKTQLALHFATKHKDEYSAVFWINGRDLTTLEQSHRIAMRRLTEVDPTAFEPSMPGKAFRDWLARPGNTEWLVIIDNVDDPQIVNEAGGLYDPQEYIPDCNSGDVIVISRSSRLRIERQIEVREIADEEDCLKILKHYARRESVRQEPGTYELLEKLKGLPLALAIAGTCLDQVSITAAEYLDQYQKFWLQLQQQSPILTEYEGRTLRTTWESSLHQIGHKSPEALNLLHVIAFLDPRDIWFELLAAGREGWSHPDTPWFLTITESKFSFSRYTRILCDHSLVRPRENATGYEMHACVHDWLREAHKDKNMTHIALRCIANMVPSSQKREYWITQKRLIPHAEHWSRARLIVDTTRNYARCLERLGSLYRDQGMIAEAADIYQQTVDIRNAIDGPDKVHTIKAKGLLGAVYTEQGKLKDAESLLLPLLARAEETGAPDTDFVVAGVQRVGILRMHQGQFSDAKSMLSRALRSKETTYGSDHPVALRIVRRLGQVYAYESNFAQAQAAYERALKGLSGALSMNHPWALDTLADLGELCRIQKDMSKAETYLVDATELLEQSLGPKHRITLWAKVSLGNLRCDQKEYTFAAKILNEAVTGLQKALGSDHSKTLFAKQSKTRLLYDEGRVAEAIQAMEEVQASFLRTLGPHHPQTCDSATSLGLVYETQNDLDLAEARFQEVLDSCRAGSSRSNVRTVTATENLARVSMKRGKYSQAEVLYTSVLDFRETLLGPDHLETLSAMEDLASVYEQRSRNDEAIELYQRALAGRETVLGHSRGDTLRIARKLGFLFAADRRRLAEAATMFQRCVSAYEQKLGPDDEKTLSVVSGLASVYEDQERMPEARATYSWLLAGYEKTVGPHHELTIKALNDLSRVQYKQTQADESSAAMPGGPSYVTPTTPPKHRGSWFKFGRKQK